jgi:hypothetical protein
MPDIMDCWAAPQLADISKKKILAAGSKGTRARQPYRFGAERFMRRLRVELRLGAIHA